MTTATNESAADEHQGKQGEHAFFFYLTRRIVSRQETATGAQVKEMIKAAVPDFDTAHTLVLEGHGHEQDRVIGDGETVSLRVGHGEQPKHFFSKPPTNFGAI